MSAVSNPLPAAILWRGPSQHDSEYTNYACEYTSMNYTALQAQVAAIIHRTDLTTPITQFIEQARVRIGADLRSQANYVTGTITSFSAGLSALPGNYSSMVSVTDTDNIPLQFIPPGEVAFNHGTYVYSVLGTDLFIPEAGAASTYNIYYYSIPAALSGGSDVSAGMSEHPSLWLYASLAEAAFYCHDLELATAANSAYATVLEAANRQGNRARFAPGVAPIASEYNVHTVPARL